MSAWRFIVSFAVGAVGLGVAALGGFLLRYRPSQFAVAFVVALLLVLACVSFAQDDGRVRGEKR